ncbi:exosortase/archaeosortase family protein [Prosthecobacter sp.]|uniref:exosortase/archaeosortase family protein n=1 Tax=Prosthecobacter sp. TaxID=1965333 RepID=UPI001DBB79CD|nr:exosortase/archaeosortase family protein [Prosthecobacter sp.]MCB1278257.1 exosortase/archaeosortase family protein [Prosthecobacter sp.]
MATESTHPTPLPAAAPAAPHALLRPETLRMAVSFGVPVVLVLLFLVWPYQQWDYGKRESILIGWARWVGTKADWQFCLLVPALVGWLVWLRRDDLHKLPWQGDWAGLLPLGLGLFVYWVGYKADTGYPGFLAVQLVLAGMILLVAGRGWMRALFFSWLFLLFTWPMQPLEDSVASPLRPRTAAMATSLLNMIGVPSVNEGSALQSAPDTGRGLQVGDAFSLDVDAKCSGINSLFALMMIAALLGYLALKRPRWRFLLFVCAVPLAVAGNVVRLLLLVAGTLMFGSDFAVGRHIGEHQEMSPYHTFAGFAVFGVALAGMFALCWLLEGREMKKNLQRRVKSVSSGTTFSIPLPRRTLAQLSAAVVLPLAALGICARTDIGFHVSIPGVKLKSDGLQPALPLSLGDYQGREYEMTAQEKNLLDEGVRLSRNVYASSTGRQIMATVILSGFEKRSLHRPEVCLPNQGWTVTDRTPIPLRLEDGREITVMMMRIFRDVEPRPGVRIRTRALNFYWYIGSNGTTCPEHYEHVFLSYYDSVFRNIQHRWAMASIYVPLPEQRVGQEDPIIELSAMEDSRAFIAQLAPAFMLKNQDLATGSNPPASAP